MSIHRFSRLQPLVVVLACSVAGVLAIAAPVGVVVADDPQAAAVGARILESGGNAVDAAVATAFALAVTLPQAGNLGGGGFLLVRPAASPGWVIDFREEAPLASTRDMFLDARGVLIPERSQKGPFSVGVPGSVAGLLLAHRRFGSLPLETLLAPAIRLAAEGFVVPQGLHESMVRYEDRLHRQPYAESLFLNQGHPYLPGETLKQPDLARMLERIAQQGEAGFYRGVAATALVGTVQGLGGAMTLRDLERYRPEERAALTGTYRGLEILTVPAPSAGGIALVEMLHILDGFDLRASGPTHPTTFHRLASAMKLAFFDRSRSVGDPAFVDVPVDRLTSPAYANRLRARLPENRALPSSSLGSARPHSRESSETTHLSVIDSRGAAVALTTTLNSSWGSGLAAEGLGYLLNNEMDDFTSAPGQPNLYGLIEGRANEIAPGKRMASSMCPTVIVQNSRPRLVLGSPGGPRIPNAILQVILQVVDFGQPLNDAVAAPRIHHQWLPDILQLEEGGFPTSTNQALEAMGYAVGSREHVGNVLAAGIDPETGALSAAADPRRYGAVVFARGKERAP